MATDLPPAPSRARVIAAFLALYLIWGSTYLAMKIVVAQIPPVLAGALRHGIAGAVLFTWSMVRHARWPTAREWGMGFLIGLMLLVIGNGTVNVAVRYVPSGLTALLVSSVPIWIVVVDWLRPDGTPPHGRVVAGLVLGVLGIGALVWTAGGTGAAHRGTSTTSLLACIALLIGSAFWAGGSIVSRHARRHPNGNVATSLEMGCAGAVLLLLSLAIGDQHRVVWSDVTATVWWSLAYLIVFGSIIGFSAYAWLLRVSTPSRVATYAYVNPLVAVMLGSAFGGERLTGGTIVGAALILGAVVMITIPRPHVLRQVFNAR